MDSLLKLKFIFNIDYRPKRVKTPAESGAIPSLNCLKTDLNGYRPTGKARLNAPFWYALFHRPNLEESSVPVPHNMVTTAFELDNFRVIRNLGIVRGITVRSRSIFGTIGAGMGNDTVSSFEPSSSRAACNRSMFSSSGR